MHFGLSVFNKQLSSGGTSGGNIAFNISSMGSKNCNSAAVNTTGSIDAGSQVVLAARQHLRLLPGRPDRHRGRRARRHQPGGDPHLQPVNFDHDNDPGTAPMKQFTINTAASTTVSGAQVALLGAQCTPSEQLDFDNRGCSTPRSTAWWPTPRRR